ncbi:MAG TPA: hypothetical protein VGK99_05475 [Acidobacteriota bacterium]
MRSLIVLALSTLAISNSVAAETWLVGSIASYHLQRDKDYCEFNPGIGVEHDIAKNTRAVIGQYNNSFCLPSAYLGISYTPLTLGNFRLGSAFIAVSGYGDAIKKKNEQQDILLAPLGVISYERGKYGVNLVLVPPHGDFKGAMGVQVKVKF